VGRFASLRHFGSLRALARASFHELRQFLPRRKAEAVVAALSMSVLAEAEHARSELLDNPESIHRACADEAHRQWERRCSLDYSPGSMMPGISLSGHSIAPPGAIYISDLDDVAEPLRRAAAAGNLIDVALTIQMLTTVQDASGHFVGVLVGNVATGQLSDLLQDLKRRTRVMSFLVCWIKRAEC